MESPRTSSLSMFIDFLGIDQAYPDKIPPRSRLPIEGTEEGQFSEIVWVRLKRFTGIALQSANLEYMLWPPSLAIFCINSRFWAVSLLEHPWTKGSLIYFLPMSPVHWSSFWIPPRAAKTLNPPRCITIRSSHRCGIAVLLVWEFLAAKKSFVLQAMLGRSSGQFF